MLVPAIKIKQSMGFHKGSDYVKIFWKFIFISYFLFFNLFFSYSLNQNLAAKNSFQPILHKIQYNAFKTFLQEIQDNINSDMRFDYTYFFKEYLNNTNHISRETFNNYWKNIYSIDKASSGCCMELAFATHRYFRKICLDKFSKIFAVDKQDMKENVFDAEASPRYSVSFKTNTGVPIEISSYVFGCFEEDAENYNNPYYLYHFGVCVEINIGGKFYHFLLDPTNGETAKVTGNLDENHVFKSIGKEDALYQYNSSMTPLLNKILRYRQPKKERDPEYKAKYPLRSQPKFPLRSPLMTKSLSLPEAKKYFSYTKQTYYWQTEKDGLYKKTRGSCYNQIIICLLQKTIVCFLSGNKTFVPFDEFDSKKDEIANLLNIGKEEKEKWVEGMFSIIKYADFYVRDLIIRNEVETFFSKNDSLKLKLEEAGLEYEHITKYLLEEAREFVKRISWGIWRFKFKSNGDFEMKTTREKDDVPCIDFDSIIKGSIVVRDEA